MTTNDTKPNTSGLRKGPRPKSNSSEVIVLDYDGTVGRATTDNQAISDQPSVRHTLSPRIFFWPVNGVDDLNLQPGVNLVPRDLWRFYTETECDDSKGLPGLMALIDREEIVDLKGELPRSSKLVVELIKRSMSHEGIQWVIDQERKGKNRPEIIDLATKRLATTRPVHLRPMTFQGRVANVRQTGEATTLGM